jgi:hypothetical protein
MALELYDTSMCDPSDSNVHTGNVFTIITNDDMLKYSQQYPDIKVSTSGKSFIYDISFNTLLNIFRQRICGCVNNDIDCMNKCTKNIGCYIISNTSNYSLNVTVVMKSGNNKINYHHAADKTTNTSKKTKYTIIPQSIKDIDHIRLTYTPIAPKQISRFVLIDNSYLDQSQSDQIDENTVYNIGLIFIIIIMFYLGYLLFSSH